MKLIIEKSVTVITPTIGSPKLADAVRSVQEQTYGNVEHLLVVDGAVYDDDAVKYSFPFAAGHPIRYASLPYNTGANGFYGHRIYAGIPHLINSDYIFFLDEDNWYDPDHVSSLVEVLEQGNDFAYSLRKIYSPTKNFICEDNCEALGKWPIFFTHEDPQFLIDTSAFAYNAKFLQRTCHHWHYGWGGDRNYFEHARMYNPKWDTNYKHTLCYRLDGNPGSVSKDFFMQGNASQLEHYNGVLPWVRT